LILSAKIIIFFMKLFNALLFALAAELGGFSVGGALQDLLAL
jgi:hypothetical protein